MLAVENPTKRQFIGIRLTTTERAAAELEAERLGVTLSAYTRRALKAYTELRKVGLAHDPRPTQA